MSKTEIRPQMIDSRVPRAPLVSAVTLALVIGQGKEIVPDDLPFSRKELKHEGFPKSLKLMEKVHIERILKEADWNISKAARELDIDRQTLYNKMEKYDIKKGGP